MKKVPLLFALLSLACGGLRAQTFDLVNGRVPVASLDGLWRFHTGDNPSWADLNFDDSKWPLMRSTESWSTQGYKDYGGMAWYRFQVIVPAGLDQVSLYLPQIYTCYEVFADGRLIGRYGEMPPKAMPFIGGGDFQIYALPAGVREVRKIEIALRIWHWPVWARYYGGGPEYGGGLIGDAKEIEDRAFWNRTADFWWGAEREILGLLETLAGLGALALFILRRKEREYLWFSLMMLLNASFELIQLSESTHVWIVELRDAAIHTVLACAGFASIAFFQQLLKPKHTWLLKLAVASVALELLHSILTSLSGNVLGIWFDVLLAGVFGLILNAWIVSVVFTRARQHSLDARLLLAPVVLSTSEFVLSYAAWTTFTLGWQRKFAFDLFLTEKPIPINLHELVAALFLLAVSAILILRFTRTRSEEERFATEFAAARSVQQYLIPEHLPPTPGLEIESQYLPAREVGGDFFQVLPDAKDGSVLIVVGDVAGKGMQAGMLATLIVGAIRTAAAFTADPARIMTLLNERLQGRGLVTCLALRIDRDGSVILINAGHLPPYLNGTDLPIEGALPLGAVPGIDFSVLRFQLAEGDSLMLMSDGIAEAQNAAGQLFGFERIAQMLHQHTTAAGLATAAQAFGQEDDITVLTVARMATAADSLTY
jgi:sigma-B regulation protein RsbU (phosphoserine phosphatase)